MRVDRYPLLCNGRGKPYSSIEQDGDGFLIRVDNMADSEQWVEVRVTRLAMQWIIEGWLPKMLEQLAADGDKKTDPTFDACIAVHGDELDLFTRFVNAVHERREATNG